MSPNFQVLWWKFAKFLLFSKPQVSFSSNFASLSNAIKIASLYFFRSNITYFSWRNQSKCKFFRLLSARIKIHQILASFETANQFFFKFRINPQCHETQLLCTFLAEILYAFNKRSLSKYKFGEIQSLKFGTLMGCLRQNNIKFQLKKKSYLSWTKFKEKVTCSFKYDMRNFVNFHLNHLKFQNFTSKRCFCPKYMRCELKNTEELSLMTLNSDAKFE